jgi:hypothetical protein
MPIAEKLTRSNFFIKLKSWEYWPFGILQFPVMLYFAWLSLRARSFLFFSASNPGIPMGGMFGESKFDVLKKVPSQYIANSAIIRVPSTKGEILNTIKKNNLGFPLIFKPDLGERGFMVERINSEDDIDKYLLKMKFDFIIQELIDLPHEYGIFYTRFPHKQKGAVTSVIMKEMLSVTGNGRSTLQELILSKDRAKLQWQKLKLMYRDRLDEVLKEGETIELVSIGNNGCGAEPAHIYHPGYPFTKALGVLLMHWRNIFIISRENARRGIPYTSFKDALGYYRRFKAAVQ